MVAVTKSVGFGGVVLCESGRELRAGSWVVRCCSFSESGFASCSGDSRTLLVVLEGADGEVVLGSSEVVVWGSVGGGVVSAVVVGWLLWPDVPFVGGVG